MVDLPSRLALAYLRATEFASRRLEREEGQGMVEYALMKLSSQRAGGPSP